jgi:glutamate mutase epsilon subunit
MELDRNKLLNIYESIEDKKKDRDEHIHYVQSLEKEIQKDILEYRIDSVSRVLDYIHTELALKKSLDLDTLITHCCNKLNGNLDGIELKLGGE